MNPITEADLQAYVDGLLEPARRTEVETYLAAHPQETERVRHYQKQNEALHELFDPVLHEPVPVTMQQRSLRIRFPMRYAALAASMVLGVMIGWGVRSLEPGRVADGMAFAQQAAIAHVVYSPEVRHPVEVGADQESHLVSWLSKRLGADIKPPHLAVAGYDLVGGRLLPGNRGPVAQFMYQDSRGQRLTLYVRTDTEDQHETAFRYAQEGSVGVFYWVDGKFGYALSGELEKKELLIVANAVYRQINP